MDDRQNSTGVQAWIDKCELAEVIAVLSSAVDRGDRARIVACYTEESYDDHGVWKGSGREFADFICGPGSLTRMHHLLGQSVLDVNGKEAWGETFFTFHGVAGTAEVSGYGRYVDYFEKADDRWKLKYRRVVPDDAPGNGAASYWVSSRDRTDPSYDRRRWPHERHPKN
jgi:hypothetical protein